MKTEQEIIQCLLDGSANHEESREYLWHIENDLPHLWRDLALGQFEAGLIRDALAETDKAHERKSPQMARWLGLAAVATAGIFIGWLLHSPASEISSLDSSPELVSFGAESNRIQHTTFIKASFDDGHQVVVPVMHYRFQ